MLAQGTVLCVKLIAHRTVPCVTTTYGYNANTNLLEWVKYPQDTDATKTVYTYDEMYRVDQAALTTDTALALSAEYTYTNDLLTSIETASTTYNFTYGNFGLRSAVKVGTQQLAGYSYENGTNRLKELDYGNGDEGAQGTVLCVKLIAHRTVPCVTIEMDYPTFERQAAHRCAAVTMALAAALK